MESLEQILDRAEMDISRKPLQVINFLSRLLLLSSCVAHPLPPLLKGGTGSGWETLPTQRPGL